MYQECEKVYMRMYLYISVYANVFIYNRNMCIISKEYAMKMCTKNIKYKKANV